MPHDPRSPVLTYHPTVVKVVVDGEARKPCFEWTGESPASISKHACSQLKAPPPTMPCASLAASASADVASAGPYALSRSNSSASALSRSNSSTSSLGGNDSDGRYEQENGQLETSGMDMSNTFDGSMQAMQSSSSSLSAVSGGLGAMGEGAEGGLNPLLMRLAHESGFRPRAGPGPRAAGADGDAAAALNAVVAAASTSAPSASLLPPPPPPPMPPPASPATVADAKMLSQVG